jgi:hypothetical protein
MLKRLFSLLSGKPAPAKAEPKKPEARTATPAYRAANDLPRKTTRTSFASSAPSRRNDDSNDLLNPLNPYSPISVFNTESSHTTTHHAPAYTPANDSPSGNDSWGGGGGSSDSYSGSCDSGSSSDGGSCGGGDITSAMSGDVILRRMNKGGRFAIK